MNNNGYINGKIERPCVMCGKSTTQIDIDFECSICSDECGSKLINEYLEGIQ